MSAKKDGISIKISKDLTVGLTKVAAQKQLESGEICSVSSLIRVALEEYIKKHSLKS